jgi:hypothetical protein
MDLHIAFVEMQGEGEQIRLQEQFDGEIEDASLPAEQILAEQRETHENDGNAPLFVP